MSSVIITKSDVIIIIIHNTTIIINSETAVDMYNLYIRSKNKNIFIQTIVGSFNVRSFSQFKICFFFTKMLSKALFIAISQFLHHISL